MRVLAVDTCLDACSVAVYDASEERVLAEESEPMARGHAEALFGLIQAAAHAARLPLAAMDRFAVTVGPGSFTGVRVGLAAARGLALAAGRPLIGITTLELMAHMAGTGEAVAAVHDAKRGEVFIEAFARSGRLVPASAVKVENAAHALRPAWPAPGGRLKLTGSGAGLLAPSLVAEGVEIDVVPHPKHLSAGLLAALAVRARPGDAKPTALYLRAPDAKLPGGVSPGIGP